MACSHVMFPAAFDVWQLAIVYILQMQSRSGTRAVRGFAKHCMTHPVGSAFCYYASSDVLVTQSGSEVTCDRGRWFMNVGCNTEGFSVT
jgi:hypothetical protein